METWRHRTGDSRAAREGLLPPPPPPPQGHAATGRPSHTAHGTIGRKHRKNDIVKMTQKRDDNEFVVTVSALGNCGNKEQKTI